MALVLIARLVWSKDLWNRPVVWFTDAPPRGEECTVAGCSICWVGAAPQAKECWRLAVANVRAGEVRSRSRLAALQNERLTTKTKIIVYACYIYPALRGYPPHPLTGAGLKFWMV
eukprot:3979882-Amphidinium_carterae.1